MATGVTEATRDSIAAVRGVGERAAGLELLVLFGSRARDDARDGSDWDLAFLGDVDVEHLRVEISRALATDAVDLVDLARAGALLRFRVARDGVALVEARPGAFDDFRTQAASFWCEVAPVVGPAYEDVLGGLRE